MIALGIIITTSISYFIWFRYTHPDSRFKYEYEKTIVRNTSNIEEANALTVAEDFNYTHIFDSQRFITSSHNDPLASTWANFIDTQVIEYCDNRYESLKGKLEGRRPEGIRFQYEANVFTWNQTRVVYVPPPEGAIQVLSQNGSVLFQNAKYTAPTEFAYRNDSEYQRITAEEINFSLSKSYVVEMKLLYDEAYGPLASFASKVYQIIIVDQDLIPFLFCIQSNEYIS